jgi:glycosyltransferase involved in cell wall biosynthesis
VFRDKMKIDVVLLTKNSLEPCLEKCVASIHKNVPVNRLIVVDGGSTDGTLELLKKDPTALIIDDSSGTRASARQIGIKAVKTDWHIMVDSDVILSNDWFNKAWEHVDDSVGAIWGAAVPVEEHFFNITYAMSKFYRTGIRELLVKQMRSERCMMHDTLIRTETVKDIKIPRNLHIWEDEYIGRHIIDKGYRFLKVAEPYCLHNLTQYERYKGFIVTGQLLRKYKLSTLKQLLRHVVVAFPKSAWIFIATRDFQAARLHMFNQVLVLKGWLAN